MTESDSPGGAAAEPDEFRFLADNAADAGVEQGALPPVRRRDVTVAGQRMSALVWGRGAPRLVLLHGGAQNAHTWDTVALAVGEPLVAVDLPGHGRSSWRSDGDYGVPAMAGAVAAAVADVAPDADTVVGVGLGASVAVLVAAARAAAGVRHLVLVDSAPGAPARPASPSATAAAVSAFTAQHRYPSFHAMYERARAYSPGRSPAALRRGLEHNAVAEADGSWRWRWDPALRESRDYGAGAVAAALKDFGGDVLIVRGGASDVVTDEAAAAVTERYRSVRVITIPGAEHGVQGSHPVALAGAIRGVRTPLAGG